MQDLNMFNEELGRNFATPDDIDEADLDAELEMLGDELEDEVYTGSEKVSTPSYLMPPVPGSKLPENPYGLSSGPNAIGNP
jgi:charged multivesicular body protein 5